MRKGNWDYHLVDGDGCKTAFVAWLKKVDFFSVLNLQTRTKFSPEGEALTFSIVMNWASY